VHGLAESRCVCQTDLRRYPSRLRLDENQSVHSSPNAGADANPLDDAPGGRSQRTQTARTGQRERVCWQGGTAVARRPTCASLTRRGCLSPAGRGWLP
jgi:hypothetical protein